ncbi:MAG: YlbL family protein, partial [Acidimicrobiales bacterium]
PAPVGRASPPGPWLRSLVAVAVLLGAVLAAYNVNLPYYALAPGQARAVNGLIQVEGAANFPPGGEVLLTTVSLRNVRAIDALVGWLDPDTDIVEQARLRPRSTSDVQFRQQNLDLMDDSKQTAVVVALRRLGHQVTERGEGGRVVSVVPDLPAAGRLERGWVITAVDGTPTGLVSDIQAAIRRAGAGHSLTIEVDPSDGSPRRTVEVPVVENPSTGSPVIGVELRTRNRSFDTPVDVKIASGSIGGPSAGLAFALGVIDRLTPGELTGGRKVAVTGELRLDGTVASVGGVAQKAAAVRRAGAEVFLVPASEAAAARSRAGDDVEVVPVASLHEALDALAGLGGDLSALGLGPAPAVPSS